jgi:histidine ammonia-lyase/phenylalanine ammonia-lyase
MLTTRLANNDLDELAIDGRCLRPAQVVSVARGTRRTAVSLSPDSERRMRESDRLKHTLIDAGVPVYGVTSGFGDSNTRQISGKKTRALQANLIAFLSCGVGPESTSDVVRATMLVRANCLARGYSGIRPEVVHLLLDCLNSDIIPVIPERGSVGASGDLVPLSYIAAMLTGQGTVLHHGVAKGAGVALAQAGLRPVELAAKEGLALVNGTSFMSGFAVLGLHDATELMFAADVCTALASQVLLGNPDHFAEFLFEQKPHDGVVASAQRIRNLLEYGKYQGGGSYTDVMLDDIGFRELDEPIQDRYSIRCAPHVVGTLGDTIAWAEKWLAVEINSSNDNPLFDVDGKAVHNGGNFYGGHVGQAMDSLKIAVASVGDLLERQLQLIVDEKFNNGLTPNLIPHVKPDSWEAGLFHGFKGMQLAASSLAAEALKWTMPATSFSRSTEAHNQDKVSMGTIAARDARSVVELVQRIAAIHLLALCQAADLRGLDKLSKPTTAAHDAVREVSRFVEADRPLHADIEHVAALIRDGALRERVETVVPTAVSRSQ